jgi:hypothetical protein
MFIGRKKTFLFGALMLLASSAFAQSWKGEVRFFGGVNAGSEDRSPWPAIGRSFGFDGAAKLSSIVQITGGYAYNGTGAVYVPICAACSPASVTVVAHEVIGGIRVGSTRHRVMPYVGVGAGIVDFRVTSKSEGLAANVGLPAKFAYATSGGLNLRITNRVGIMAEVRMVKPMDAPWYVRSSGGIFVHF